MQHDTINEPNKIVCLHSVHFKAGFIWHYPKSIEIQFCEVKTKEQ